MTTITDQIDALKKQAEREANGKKLAAAAVGNEFQPPQNLEQAASIIAKLRQDRDVAVAKTNAACQTIESNNTNFAISAQAVVDGRSPAHQSLAAVHKLVKDLQAELGSIRTEFETLRDRTAAVFTDMGLARVPWLTGYFYGATPLARAAEAAAVMLGASFIKSSGVVDTDKAMKESYLRRRGWQLKQGGWQRAGDSYPLPFVTALSTQYKDDVKGFIGIETGADPSEQGRKQLWREKVLPAGFEAETPSASEERLFSPADANQGSFGLDGESRAFPPSLKCLQSPAQ
jgi:hypothetical protein